MSELRLRHGEALEVVADENGTTIGHGLPAIDGLDLDQLRWLQAVALPTVIVELQRREEASGEDEKLSEAPIEGQTTIDEMLS